jgi:hypothetical protein
MSDLKNDLQHIFDVLKGIETRARGLKNQNLADIAASAHGRVKQLIDHPDTELVEERKDQAHPGSPVYVAPATADEAVAKMRAEGDADPENTARMNWPHLFGLTGSDHPDTQLPHPSAPFPHAMPPSPPRVPLGADGYPRQDR